MSRELLGSATTDTNGVAVFEYTGTGAGLLNIQAETEDGSIVSNIREVWDTLFYDNGIEGDHRSDWTANSVQASYSDAGTTLTVEGSSSSSYVANYTITGSSVVEFDVTRYASTNPRFVFKGYQFYLTTSRTPIDTEVHIKGEYDSTTGKIKYWIDGVYIDEFNTSTANAVSFLIYDNGIKFRNFKIYSL